MTETNFQFHGDLNQFLPYRRRDKLFTHQFDHTASIKDMIESLGVPHPEIDLIIVNGVSVDFNYLVQADDQIEVYPPFIAVEIVPLIHLIPPPMSEARFVLDTHLGKLATYLRMLGFDTLYSNMYEDDELAEISSRENRILLTRDLGVLKRGIVAYGYFVRNTNPEKQIVEILQRYDLKGSIIPFKRCIACNGRLIAVEKAAIRDQLPTKADEYYDEFHQCGDCGKFYWRGSHHERMQQFIERVVSQG